MPNTPRLIGGRNWERDPSALFIDFHTIQMDLMFGPAGGRRSKGQIAFEFIIVYSFILVLFLVLFGLVAVQRSTTLNAQQYASVQLVAQDIASYIDQALVAGSGYNATLSLPVASSLQPYNLFITSGGAVITNETVGTVLITGIAYSSARDLLINGTIVSSYNGITVYSVPAYTGSLKIANNAGVVYIDATPPSPAAHAQRLSAKVTAETKAAQFNGASSYIGVPAISGLTSTHTTIAWINPASVGASLNMYIIDMGGNNNWIQLYDAQSNGALEVRAGSSGSSYVNGIYQFKNPNGWYFIAVTQNSTNVLTIYVNGVFDNSGTVTSQAPGAITIGEAGSGGTFWNGSVADVQIYNTSLSATQISQLYQEGIGGAPIKLQNLVGWWPLDGNANDYSGNGNNGVPANINYDDVAQIGVHVSTGSASGSSNTLLGAATGFGSPSVSGSQSGKLQLTNSNGNATVFVTTNSPVGMADVTINAFNYNASLQSHLVGWWPLDEGYGSAVHDMSGNGNNGTFVGQSWTQFANTSAFQVAQFDGQGAGTYTGNIGSYINVTGSPVLKPTNVTVGAWVKANSDTPWMLVAGVQTTAGWGSYYLSMTGNSSGEMTFGTYNGTLPPVRANSTSLELGKWYYVTGTYNGTDASIYVDGRLSASVPDSQLIYYLPAEPFRIGNLNGFDDWNGIIANVQVYNTSLSAQQIAQQYAAGITAMPLSNTGLVGWWPLDGNANDYSVYANSGTANSVTFSNTQTAITATGSMPVANFNGASNYVDLGNPASLQFPSGNTITAAAWIKIANCNHAGTIIGHGTSSYILYYYPAAGGTCNINFASSNVANIGTGVPITTGAWHNVVVVNNIDTNVYIYIDGTQYGPYTFTNTYSYTEDLRIGDSQSDSGYFFNGSIANVQIYNTSLTQQQVQQLYAQGLPLYAKVNVSLS